MSNFAKRITPHVEAEFEAAQKAREENKPDLEFKHLENAHVLGQSSTYWHTLTHCKMLAWSIRNKALREFLGQAFRIVGAATKTAIGLVPEGNTGGANISPFKRLPVPDKLATIIQLAKTS